jgi:low affinity Fe/Cu permease
MHHRGRSRRQPPARPARAVHGHDGERKPARGHGSWLERLSSAVARWSGSAAAQVAAFAVVVVWLATGPIFHYSDTWQLVINTGTTIITFLMVFTIQRAQNKESAATVLRLSEIIAALEGASNRMIDVGYITEA